MAILDCLKLEHFPILLVQNRRQRLFVHFLELLLVVCEDFLPLRHDLLLLTVVLRVIVDLKCTDVGGPAFHLFASFESGYEVWVFHLFLFT